MENPHEKSSEGEANNKISLALSILSHDLKTPLTTIIGGADCLLELDHLKVQNWKRKWF